MEDKHSNWSKITAIGALLVGIAAIITAVAGVYFGIFQEDEPSAPTFIVTVPTPAEPTSSTAPPSTLQSSEQPTSPSATQSTPNQQQQREPPAESRQERPESDNERPFNEPIGAQAEPTTSALDEVAMATPSISPVEPTTLVSDCVRLAEQEWRDWLAIEGIGPAEISVELAVLYMPNYVEALAQCGDEFDEHVVRFPTQQILVKARTELRTEPGYIWCRWLTLVELDLNGGYQQSMELDLCREIGGALSFSDP